MKTSTVEIELITHRKILGTAFYKKNGKVQYITLYPKNDRDDFYKVIPIESLIKAENK